MLFNCLQCGKMISSHKEICPYCRKDMSDVVEELNTLNKGFFSKKNPAAENIRQRHKGTILSVVLR